MGAMNAGWFSERFSEKAGRIRFDCLACQRPMWFPPSKHGKYLTCGDRCAELRVASIIAERSRKCDGCGNTFTPRPRQVRLGHGRFCSDRCALPSLLAAAHAPAARAKSAAKAKLTHAAGLSKYRIGPDNSRWNGGARAAYLRRRDSGKAAASLRSYRRQNPEKVKEFAMRRRGRKYGRLPKGTMAVILQMQRWRCPACSANLRKTGYHQDHRVALALGGKHEPKNIQALCPPCNLHKSDADEIAFMQKRGFLL